MSELRRIQTGAPPMSPGAMFSVVLGVLLIVGAFVFFKPAVKLPHGTTKMTKSLVKSFH